MPSLRHIDFSPEIKFKTSRSGGAGGQNVNKVETRVELIFNLPDSLLLSTEQILLIQKQLPARFLLGGIVHIVVSESRSQLGNKKIAVVKLYQILEKALVEEKKRKKRKPTRAMKEKRLKSKKRLSEKKANRNWKGDNS